MDILDSEGAESACLISRRDSSRTKLTEHHTASIQPHTTSAPVLLWFFLFIFIRASCVGGGLLSSLVRGRRRWHLPSERQELNQEKYDSDRQRATFG